VQRNRPLGNTLTPISTTHSILSNLSSPVLSFHTRYLNLILLSSLVLPSNASMREQYNPFLGQSRSEESGYRLPKNVKPTHYDIHIEPDLDNGSFEGSVVIHFDVLEDSTFILLNTNEIEIHATTLLLSSGKATKINDIHYHEVQQTVTVPLPEPITAGSRIRLHQTFKGRLNDTKKLSGFNRSRYIGRDGKSKWIGSTQGEPTGARQIFPCADEPALKATYTVTLIVPQDLTALSNMDIASEKSIGRGKKVVTFNKTPPMSTYLVTFVVGELNYIESNEFRIPVRVYATPDHDIKAGNFCLHVGAQAMISHEKTFGSPYPLPKLDMVAIPGHSGGMENWGLVLYGEKYLISDETDGSALETQLKAKIVIHELAHQWFGNIVTAEWWDSLWLNESFADWATFNAITTMYPEWDIWSDFVAGNPEGGLQAYQAALALDSNRGSHPIENKVNTPGEIAQVFDAITYAKGCTILRMISELLGVEVFIAGVRLYLKSHAFGNATTNVLWDALSLVSGKDVPKLVSTWTSKVGYPLLYVREDEDSDTITITQHRFLQSGKILPEDDKVLYPVYLNTKINQGIDETSHLFSRSDKFAVDLNFYKLNSGQTGLYRVLYPLSRWEKLGKQLYTPGLLTPSDRVGLISDLRAVVTAGQTPARTSHLLTFLSNFRAETSYFAWRQLLVCLADIHKAFLFESPALLSALSKFQASLMSKILGEMDQRLWDFKKGESNQEQSFKAVLFGNAKGYEPVKVIASYLFDLFLRGETQALNPNIRAAVFRNILSDEKLSIDDDNVSSIPTCNLLSLVPFFPFSVEIEFS
jgi:aminopeptidase 2